MRYALFCHFVLSCAGIGLTIAPRCAALDRPFWTALDFKDGTVVVDCNERGLFFHVLVHPFLSQHPEWLPAGPVRYGGAHRPLSASYGLGGPLRLYAIRPDNTVIEHTPDQITSYTWTPSGLRLNFASIESAQRRMEIVSVPEQSTLLFHYNSHGFGEYKLRLEIDGTAGCLTYPNPVSLGTHNFGEGMWTFRRGDDYLIHRYGLPIDPQHNPCGALFYLQVSGTTTGLTGGGVFQGASRYAAHTQYHVADIPHTMGPVRSEGGRFLTECIVGSNALARFGIDLEPAPEIIEFGLVFADNPEALFRQIARFRPQAADAGTAQEAPDSRGRMEKRPYLSQLAPTVFDQNQMIGVHAWSRFAAAYWDKYAADAQVPIAADRTLRTNFKTRMTQSERDFYTACLAVLRGRTHSNGLLMPQPPGPAQVLESAPFDLFEQTLANVTLARMGLVDDSLRKLAALLLRPARREAGPPVVVLHETDLPALLEQKDTLIATLPRMVPLSSVATTQVVRWVEGGGRLLLLGGADDFFSREGAILPAWSSLLAALHLAGGDGAVAPYDDLAAKRHGRRATQSLSVLAAAGPTAGARLVDFDLTREFARSDETYLLIEHDAGLPEQLAAVREITVYSDIGGATAMAQWRPNTNEELRHLVADVETFVEYDTTEGRLVRRLGPTAYVAYRIRAARGARVGVLADVAGPYRIRAGESVPSSELRVVTAKDARAPVSEGLGVPREYNPVLFQFPQSIGLLHVAGEKGALAVGLRRSKGYVALVGLPPEFVVFEPSSAKLIDLALESAGRDLKRPESLAVRRPIWGRAFHEDRWIFSGSREADPIGAPCVIWAVAEMAARTGDRAYHTPALVQDLFQAAERVRTGQAFDGRTGLFMDQHGTAAVASRSRVQTPAGDPVVQVESLALNALWHAAYRQLETLASKAHERGIAKAASQRADALKAAVERVLRDRDTGMYHGGIVWTASGDAQPFPLNWPVWRDESALIVALLEPTVAPWSRKEQSLLLGQMLGSLKGGSSLTRLALACAETPQRESLVQQVLNEVAAGSGGDQTLAAFTGLPLRQCGETKSLCSLDLALALYALCSARADR